MAKKGYSVGACWIVAVVVALVGVPLWLEMRNPGPAKPQFEISSLGLPVAWQMEFPRPPGLFPHLVADDGMLFFADDQPTFHAVSQDGKHIWELDYDEPIGRIQNIVPIGENYICFISREGKAVAVDREGNIIWEFLPRPWEADQHRPTPNGPKADLVVPQGKMLFGVTEYGEMAWVVGNCDIYQGRNSTIFDESYGVIYTNESREIVKLDLPGKEHWRYNPGYSRRQMLGNNGTLYMDDQQGTVALDANGIVLWQTTGSVEFLGFEDDGILLGNSINSELQALDLSGNLIWKGTGEGWPHALGKVNSECFVTTEMVQTTTAQVASQLGVSGDLANEYDTYLSIYHIDGELLWHSVKLPEEMYRSLTLPNGLLLCVIDKTLYAIDLPTVIEEFQP